MIPSISNLSQPVAGNGAPSPFPQHQTAGRELILGTPQIAVIGFVVVALVSLVGSVAYLAGRLTQGVAQASPMTRPHEEIRVIEPPAAPAVQAVAKPAPLAPVPAAVSVAAVLPAPAAAPAPTPMPQPAVIYFQVAAVDKGMAEVTTEFLMRKGLSAEIKYAPDLGVYRVVVGPILSAEDQNSTKNALESAGFHPFLRRF